jgi:hypothetical protein
VLKLPPVWKGKALVEINEAKYITFKREEFYQMLGHWSAKWMPSADVALLLAECESRSLDDAVIIRRQDRFASPCLLSYAAMISLVAENYPDEDKYRELQVIADYFHQQGVLAGEEGFKLPDL